jgi:hypothetical protein
MNFGSVPKKPSVGLATSQLPEEKLALLDLARIWMQATERTLSPVVIRELPPKMQGQ